MEKIGNIGWFITDEEKAELETIIKRLEHILNVDSEKKGEPTITEPNTIPYDPNQFRINDPYPQCPNCPWKNPNPNIGDWTWRPWQAPWYGPWEPVPTDWKIGDGEWWKHQPYCTSTTGDNPDVVKETLTAQNKAEGNDTLK